MDEELLDEAIRLGLIKSVEEAYKYKDQILNHPDRKQLEDFVPIMEKVLEDILKWKKN